jgi:hypothetical protein
MSRPKPNVLLEYTNSATYKCEQVLDAEAIWAVFYQDKPFNLKSSNALTSYPGPKYKKPVLVIRVTHSILLKSSIKCLKPLTL